MNAEVVRRPRVVRERIDPHLTASLFANYRSSTDALLELLDNAIDSHIGGTRLQIELTLLTGSMGLTVTGGRGVGPREIENHYLRWGASPRRAGESIGRYGQGGKAAIGHLGNRFEILASRAGDDRAHPFSDPQYRDRTRLRTYELHIGPSRWPWTWATCTFRSARSIGNSTPCGSD